MGEASAIHGTDPQNLIGYIVRKKVYDSPYWKESCHGLSAETIVDNVELLDHIGGTYGGLQKPTEFICLVLKMLQIQPGTDVVREYIKCEKNKYLRVLGAFYLRLTGKSAEIYRYLEPLYTDYAKIRVRKSDGTFFLSHVDEFIDDLLRKGVVLDTTMPRIRSRYALEAQGILDPKVSALENGFVSKIRDAQMQLKEVEETSCVAGQLLEARARAVPHSLPQEN